MRIVANSQWFMEPEAWELLANDLLPQLADGAHRFTAWSAGCSTGKEPFSLAVLLREAQPDLDFLIHATDKDAAALAALHRCGPFTQRDIENIPADWQHRHLEPGTPTFACSHLLDRMTIAKHDLLHDPFLSNVDLILYRNLETCFSAEENSQVWRGFAGSLRVGGILFAGALDRVPHSVEHLFQRSAPCLYVRNVTGLD
jgi:chemotaxis protein methyltransferase CheR